jgi:hypothetical protein
VTGWSGSAEPRELGSHSTLRWRKADSNHRSRSKQRGRSETRASASCIAQPTGAAANVDYRVVLLPTWARGYHFDTGATHVASIAGCLPLYPPETIFSDRDPGAISADQ